jgi:hypothetical protein
MLKFTTFALTPENMSHSSWHLYCPWERTTDLAFGTVKTASSWTSTLTEKAYGFGLFVSNKSLRRAIDFSRARVLIQWFSPRVGFGREYDRSILFLERRRGLCRTMSERTKLTNRNLIHSLALELTVVQVLRNFEHGKGRYGQAHSVLDSIYQPLMSMNFLINPSFIGMRDGIRE